MNRKSLVTEIQNAEQSEQPLRWLDWINYGQKVILNALYKLLTNQTDFAFLTAYLLKTSNHKL